MVATISQIIGKVNPELYAENYAELKKKYKNLNDIPADEIKPKAISKHELTYDSAADQLEPLYFFILDLMNDFKLNPEKLVDNFSASEGSSHYGDMAQKKGINQQQGQNALAQANTILRSVLNLVYDLKEMRIRLNTYEDLKSKELEVKQGAKLSLKQIWIDKVDMLKGNSSIAMMARQLGFQTLFDAFFAVDDEKGADKLDLNERVKRTVKARIHEFNVWMEYSQKELNKRYEIERNYLKSQVNSLKLYSRWAKPYLLAAKRLESTQSKDAALVTAFDTTIMELTLFGGKKIDVKASAVDGDLPQSFMKVSEDNFKRAYSYYVLVEFKFRGIPRKITQRGDYVFGGRTDIVFRAYAFNSEELKKLEQEIKKADVEDVLGLIEGATGDSLKQLQEEIEFFINEKVKDEKKEEKENGDNPFLALIGHYNKSEKPKEEKKDDKNKPIVIKKENWYEKEYLRKLANKKAEDTNFKLFDIYKKAHGMPSYT